MKRFLIITGGLMAGLDVVSQEAAVGPDLAQQLANPVESLIRVP